MENDYEYGRIAVTLASVCCVFYCTPWNVVRRICINCFNSTTTPNAGAVPQFQMSYFATTTLALLIHILILIDAVLEITSVNWTLPGGYTPIIVFAVNPLSCLSISMMTVGSVLKARRFGFLSSSGSSVLDKCLNSLGAASFVLSLISSGLYILFNVLTEMPHRNFARYFAFFSYGSVFGVALCGIVEVVVGSRLLESSRKKSYIDFFKIPNHMFFLTIVTLGFISMIFAEFVYQQQQIFWASLSYLSISLITCLIFKTMESYLNSIDAGRKSTTNINKQKTSNHVQMVVFRQAVSSLTPSEQKQNEQSACIPNVTANAELHSISIIQSSEIQ